MDKLRILVVDDDRDIRTLLGKYLTQNGYDVSLASNGEEMHAALAENHANLIILDVMMPGDDGYELCRQIRQKSDTPIIMLTAIGEEFERIVGLEIGADDYMSKPFNPRELLARIKAVLRRAGSEGAQRDEKEADDVIDTNILYEFESWALDKGKRVLLSPDKLEISITGGEYDLLLALLEHPNTVLSRDQLLNFTKNRDAGPFDRSIDIQISRLRRRIEKDPKNPRLIKTIRGGGYTLASKVNKVQASD